jgi:steroid 5-alpha reductase family enzyme
MTPPHLLLWGTLGACLLQLGLWAWHLRTRNAGWVDVGWALSLGLLALLCAWKGGGAAAPRLLVAVMGGSWGLRLAAHLGHRVATDEHEDGRYRELRRTWGGNLDAKFLGFFLFQGVLAAVLALPFALAAQVDALQPIQLGALGLWLVALLGESLADGQLRRFKSRPEAKGRTCREGLWRYSRHPNYFFEFLLWVSFSFLATVSPWGYLSWIAPALILYFLLFVTGIPYTEAQSLRSRPEDYASYQRETSAFVPWFPKVTE